MVQNARHGTTMCGSVSANTKHQVATNFKIVATDDPRSPRICGRGLQEGFTWEGEEDFSENTVRSLHFNINNSIAPAQTWHVDKTDKEMISLRPVSWRTSTWVHCAQAPDAAVASVHATTC